MSKTGDYYMYVYKLDNGYYMRILPDNLSSFDDTKLTDDGTRLCNNTIKIRMDSSTGNVPVEIISRLPTRKRRALIRQIRM